jgi:beta-glucanase (GH16 family)
MHLNKILLLLLPVLLLPATSLNATGKEKWKLIWHDEFNRNGPIDTTCWKYEEGFIRNDEPQWYQRDNVYCRDGKLILEARREKKPNPTYNPAGKYYGQKRPFIEATSGSVQTRGLKEFCYGRIVVRARIPVGLGSWPAIWTLGDSLPWPACGEVDIMEFYRVKGEPKILANAAWGGDTWELPHWNTKRVPYNHFTAKDPHWAEKFHIWRMDWDKHAMKIYLDNELLNDIPIDSTINGRLAGGGINPFKRPHFILLDMALRPSDGNVTDFPLPMKYEIDYVRVYRKQ